MEFEHVRKERERREKEEANKLAYQKRDAEWKKRQLAKKPFIENRQKIAHEEALAEMSTSSTLFNISLLLSSEFICG